jgi:hypothetical protein
MSIYIKGTDGCCPGCSPNDPCVAPAAPSPTLVCEYITATLTKCGYEEYPSHVSTPPKIYRTMTLSGTVFACGFVFDPSANCYSSGDSLYTINNTFAFSGSNSFSRSSCSFTAAHRNEYSDSSQGSYYAPCVASSNLVSSASYPYGVDRPYAPYDSFTNTFTSTTRTLTGDGCVSNFYSGGSASETLSDEYTTAQLIADTEAALPSYSGSFSSGSTPCSSYCNLSTDESTYTIRRRKFKFLLPDLTGYSCYKIMWVYRYVRNSDGYTVDFASNYWIWDGVSTESPVFGSEYTDFEYESCKYPNDFFGGLGGPGTISIVNITASCSCIPPP